jgi:hypothetical protein
MSQKLHKKLDKQKTSEAVEAAAHNVPLTLTKTIGSTRCKKAEQAG